MSEIHFVRMRSNESTSYPGMNLIDRGTFAAAEALHSFSSPNRRASNNDSNDDRQLSSPFSTLDALVDSVSISPSSSSINLSAASPFPYSPFSFSSQAVQTPLDIHSVSRTPGTFSARARNWLSPFDDLGSPLGRREKPLRKSKLFPDTHLSLDSPGAPSPKFGTSLRGHSINFKPVDVNEVIRKSNLADKFPQFDGDDNSSGFMTAPSRPKRATTSSSLIFDNVPTPTGSLSRTSSSDTNDDELEGEKISLPSNQKSSKLSLSTTGSFSRGKTGISLSSASSTSKLNLSTGSIASSHSSSVSKSSSAKPSKQSSVSTTSPSVQTGDYGTPGTVPARGQPTISPLFPDSEQRQCNCKMSKCLKLYCECFQVLSYCGDHCRCLDCYNRADMEAIRQEAVQATKDRNNTAFQNKVSTQGHSSGCNCKKSQCLKKYCECFEGGVYCGPVCKCKSCANYLGSTEREKTLKEKEKKMMQQKDKEVVTLSSSAKKRKLPEFEREERNRAMMRSGTKRVLRSDRDSPVGSDGDSPSQIKAEMEEADGEGESVQEEIDSEESRDGHPIERGHSLRSTNSGENKSSNNNVTIHQSRPEHKKMNSSSSQSLTPTFHSKLKRPPFTTPSPSSSPDSESTPRSGPLKKRRFQADVTPMSDTDVKKPPLYSFFGPENPNTQKLVGLKVLEYLDGKELYTMSLVDRLWSVVTMDEALWEN